MTRVRYLLTCLAAVALVACSDDDGNRFALEDVSVGWTALPPPPEVRSKSASAWTGEKLLTWGGQVFTGYGGEASEGDGYAFDAAALEWRSMSDSPLAARQGAAAAWTGDELLIWGGADAHLETFFRDGAAYDPDDDTWRPLPEAPISARAPLSVWTGDELLVWGTNARVDPRPLDGAAYDPEEDAWRPIAEAPIELTDSTAVWTGIEMIVFGAALHGGNFPETPKAIGAAYDPDTDAWRELPDSSLSPQASTAAWNGDELIAWDYGNKTAAYAPKADSWRELPDVPLDAGECSPASVTVGDDVFGDYCGRLTLFDSAAEAWRDISRAEVARSAVELVVAESSVFLLTRNAETGDQKLLVYRPD